VSIDYRILKAENAAAIARLKIERAEHIAKNPWLLLEQCRRLVAEQATKTKIVERSAQSIPVITKRRDDSLVDPTEEQRWSRWWDEKFVATFEMCWPMMFEKIQQQFEATNAGLRAEVAELRERLCNHVHASSDESVK